MIYILVVYLGSLFALLINSFFYLEEFTGLVVRQFTLRTYAQLFSPTNLGIFGRTAGMALAVTIADAIIAFPLGYYIARYASPKAKTYLIYRCDAASMVKLSGACVCVETDPCQGRHYFLVLQFIWTSSHSRLAIVHSAIGGSSLSLSPIGMFIAFCYIWLPYMIVPIQTAWSVCQNPCWKHPVTWAQMQRRRFVM